MVFIIQMEKQGLTTRSGNLLENTLASLPEDKRAALLEKAISKRLEMDVAEFQAIHAIEVSNHDIDKTISSAAQLGMRKNVDFDVSSTHKTASGTTTITVKKSNANIIITIAIAIAVIGFMMFLLR